MAAQLGGQQISALLESLPGIASVLRSPVADAIVSTIRAGAGLGDFKESDANELVQFAVRRGLLGSEEGEALLAEVKEAVKATRGRARKRATKTKKAKTTKAAAKTPAKKKATKKKVTAKKSAPRAVKKTKATKKAAKRAR